MKYKVSIPLLSCLLCMHPPLRAADNDALQMLTEFLTAAKKLSAGFTQTYQQDHEQKQATGVFFLQKPGKFRWEYKTPHAQLVVGDGTKIFVYDPDLNQVSVKLQDDVLGKTPALLLSGGAKLTEDFEVIGAQQENDLARVVLAPKGRDNNFKTVSFSFANGVMREMILIDQFDLETTFTFNALKMNPALDEGLFHFQPSEKMDVIGDL